MKSFEVKPPVGNDTYRFGDSDDLILVDNLRLVPADRVYLENYSVVTFVTQGKAQFEYDSVVTQIQKNDLFLYMTHSVAANFMSSPDFCCRQIWFTRSELWNINIFSETMIEDMSQLKLHPVVHLSAVDINLLDTYFCLLCNRMTDPSPSLHRDIVRSLFSTMLLEMLSIMRRPIKEEYDDTNGKNSTSLYKKQLVDKFILLVQQSDGRIRRVNDFANKLHITPKYLSTILKEVMNRRPSIYIQLFTMKAIERRLRFTDMTMQEIAHELNFPNPSFFGKYFKEHTGMTPMEYRLKYHMDDLKG